MGGGVKVTVKYFAAVREQLGPQEEIDCAPGLTLGGVRDVLIARSARHAEALGRGRGLRVALNQAMADEAAMVEAGAEVAFFPPVTGG